MTVSDDVGSRTIRYNGKSEFSGEFVVEDVTGDGGEISRRLIFLNNPNVIQSDVALSVVKKKGKERILFKRVLACEHHQIMSLSFGLLHKFFKHEGNINTLLIGLGGGLLASFLVDVFQEVNLTAVEIDKEIVKVAHNYFGLTKQSDRLHVVIDDGLKFLCNTENAFHVILLDVDNKSVTEGLSCPPPAFLEEKMLLQMKERLDPNSGLLVLNLVCRNPKVKTSYINLVSRLFPLVYSYQVGRDLNNLLFCFLKTPPVSERQWNNEIKGAIQWVESVVMAQSKVNHKGYQRNTSFTSSGDIKQFFDEDLEFIKEQFKVIRVSNKK